MKRFELDGSIQYRGSSGFQLRTGRPIRFEGDEGKAIIITGENNAGKTTMLRAITGDPKVEVNGTLNFTFNGKDPNIVYMPQNLPVEVIVKPVKISDYVNVREEMVPIADEMGVPLDRMTNEVSLGTLRKAQILRTLFLEGDVYVLDEPTSNLDRAAKRSVANIIIDGMRRGKWFIVACNDPGLCGEIATDIIFLTLKSEGLSIADYIHLRPMVMGGMAGLTLRRLARFYCEYFTSFMYKEGRVTIKRGAYGEEIPDVI